MYAVIRSGGLQYRVAQGDVVRLGKLAGDVGAPVDFDEVLAVHNGEELTVGSPLIPSAKVSGRVVRHGRGAKITVFHFKKRKGYHLKKGHRQDFTEVKIENIAAS
jgi:large subunit ribosomal protein L21